MRLAHPRTSAPPIREAQLVDTCRRDICPLFGDPAFLVIGQRKARGAGNTPGICDVLVCYAGWVVLCEFKSPDGTGEVSRAQQIVAEWCWSNGVDTVGIESAQGFTDVLSWCRRHPREATRLPHSLVAAMETCKR